MSLADAFHGRNVLVTGGLGFLGSNLAIRLARCGANVTILDSLIPQFGGSFFNISPVRNQVAVNISDMRDALAARLSEAGIGIGIHYPTPIHRMCGYDFLGYSAGSLPITERAARRVLSLPCYPELDHEAVRRVCSAVNDVLGT